MSELTKEWLLKTIAELEEERDAVPGVVNEDAAMSLAAMKIALASLEAEPVPVSMKDHQIRELVNELRDIAVEYHGTQQLRERIARTIRAAMLQGADGKADDGIFVSKSSEMSASNITIDDSRCSNSTVIPDGWVACSDRLPDPDSAFRVCAYTPTPHEDFRFRSVPASLFKSVCRDATHWQYMLPPAAPQQE
ncbi:hypothetical protein [Enterobacter sp.]|uniref:hypothetical protein n=1 Tax=Enterobacter sp. TaxID=42895 RepID=UPI00257E5EC8|nr:hypothetical protein [Enterobacter sp.]